MLAALLTLVAAQTAASTSTLQQADAAYGLFDVSKAERLYRQVAADPSSGAADRASAVRELARIAWLVDGDSARARTALELGLPSDPDPCPGAYLLARIAADNSLAWPRVLVGLEAPCGEIEPGIGLERIRHLERNALRASGTERERLLRDAKAALDAMPASARTSMLGNTLRLSLGINARDAKQALEGWQAYFWLEPGQLAPQALAMPGDHVRSVFENGLAPHATGEARTELLALLMRAGFFEILENLDAQGYRATDSTVVSRLGAYRQMRRDLSRLILAHDRAYARAGATDEAGYEARLTAILERTARTVDPASKDVMATLRAAFGLWGTNPGKTNGVSGIHLGHVVVDEQQRVSQDGRIGTIRFIAIDNMVHNSFSAWLMDGRSAPGGWAVDGATIVQVRPRYLQLIDGYARLAHPGAARRRAEAEALELSASDREIVKAQPIAFLPGVRARLRLQGIDRLTSLTRATASSAEDFEIAFRKAYWSALVTSSITAHEGRHVLDQSSFRGGCVLSNDELEFRAKLSEIRFAPVPKLALSSIYGPLFGGESGHGIANERLIRALVRWMDEHRSQLPDLRADKSLIEQLDLLSDNQLVDAARLLEPPPTPCSP